MLTSFTRTKSSHIVVTGIKSYHKGSERPNVCVRVLGGWWGLCVLHTYITQKRLCTDKYIDRTNTQMYSLSNAHKANSISPQKCRINGHVDKYTPDIPIHTIKHTTVAPVNTHAVIHQKHGNEHTSPTLIYHSDWK